MAEMLRFSQSTQDHHNTEFTLDSDGRVVIKVHTDLPLKEFTANTTVFDVVLMDEVGDGNKTGQGAIMQHQKVERVAEMDFYTHSERDPRVRLRGREGEREVREYLERNGNGKKQTFIASSGCAYTWADFKLRLDDNREVGRYYRRKSKAFGLFGPKHPAYLELERDQVTDIGEIVLTLVCVLYETDKHAHLYI